MESSSPLLPLEQIGTNVAEVLQPRLGNPIPFPPGHRPRFDFKEPRSGIGSAERGDYSDGVFVVHAADYEVCLMSCQGIPSIETVRLALMEEKTWHHRLQDALTVRKKTYYDLHQHLTKINKIANTSVYSWQPDAGKRSKMMNGDNAALVCAYLGINALWLFHNQGPSGLEMAEDDFAKAIRAEHELNPYELILSGLDALVIVGTAQDQIVRAIEEKEEQAKMTLAAVMGNNNEKAQLTNSKAATNHRRRRVYYDEDVNGTPLNQQRSARNDKRRKGDSNA